MAMVVCGPARSHAQAASGVETSAADLGAQDSEAPTGAGAENPNPAPALTCDADTASLIAERNMAVARIAQLEPELDAARSLTDSMNGQVRNAQRIIRDLEAQRDSLEEKMSGSGDGQCGDPNLALECAASVSENDALHAQVNACTAGADLDGSLRTRIDELSAQVAAVSAERDALRASLDTQQAETGGGETRGETTEDNSALQAQLDTLAARKDELIADLSDSLDSITALTIQRDQALADADAAQVVVAEAVAERDVARDKLAEAEARMVEVRAAAVTAIGASSGALTVCENSPVSGGVVLADEPTARAFKSGLGVLGEDMEVLVSPVPSTGFACVLQPIAGLLAPASQRGNAFVADYGTSVQVVAFLPQSTDCRALLDTKAVQDAMANAEGFGSAKRALWVQNEGAPTLCGERNGQVGLLRVEPRDESAVFFLTAQTF